MPASAPLGAAMLHVALLTLMAVLLSGLVISQRRSGRVGIGDGGDKALARAVRVHANFAENAPFAAAAYILLALGGMSAWAIHALGAVFLIGRVAHAAGLMHHEGASLGRVIGMVATFTVLIAASVSLLVEALG